MPHGKKCFLGLIRAQSGIEIAFQRVALPIGCASCPVDMADVESQRGDNAHPFMEAGLLNFG
jgi:hypothetical protein